LSEALVERVVLLLYYLIKMTRINHIAGCIGGVVVAIVFVVIFVLFIRYDTCSTILSTKNSDK
jgi:hypothetical protein